MGALNVPYSMVGSKWCLGALTMVGRKLAMMATYREDMSTCLEMMARRNTSYMTTYLYVHGLCALLNKAVPAERDCGIMRTEGSPDTKRTFNSGVCILHLV